MNFLSCLFDSAAVQAHPLPVSHQQSFLLPACPEAAWLVRCVVMAMEEGALSCLVRSRTMLEQDIKASYLMDHMVSDGVLTGDEEEMISKQVSRNPNPSPHFC